MNRETYVKINSAEFKQKLQEAVTRCVSCNDEYDKKQLEEKVLALMEPKIDSLSNQNKFYKEDLAQELRICVMETLRRGAKGQLRYNPEKGKPYIYYINAALKLAMISFLEKYSSVPANIERALFKEDSPYDETTKEILKSISRPSALPVVSDIRMSSVSVEDEIDYETALEKQIGFNSKIRDLLESNIEDPRLATIIMMRLRGYAKRDLRKKIKCQWSTLDSLLEESNRLLEAWEICPPEWLVDLLNEVENEQEDPIQGTALC